VSRAAKLLQRKLGREQIKIYQLVETLVQHQVYEWSSDPLISLYQKLFITQAALCELYFEFELRGNGQLCMTPVAVFVDTGDTLCRNGRRAGEINKHNETLVPNFDFFGDHENFYAITGDELKALLGQFWIKYDAFFSRQDALDVLGLRADAGWDKIKQAFRELASLHHPDRGGNSDTFIKVRRAYESLKSLEGAVP